MKSQKGSAVLEMALVLPILLMLLFGVVEFGRVLMVKQAITNAAREGARAGAVDLNDSGALQKALDVTRNYLSASGLDANTTSVVPSFVITGGSDALQVIIEYDYDSLLTSWIPTVPATFTLRSIAIMRREV